MTPALNAAKNAISGSGGWFVLFEVQVSDLERLYLVNNEEELTFAGQIYSPFPIGFEVMEETTTGDLPVVNLTVGNVSREIQSFMEHRGGLLDRTVVMRIVHTSALSDSTAALTNYFTIRASSVTEMAASFRLSQHPFLEVPFPHQRYHRSRCRFAFKGTECGWDPAQAIEGSDTCDKTMNGPVGCVFHGGLYTAAGNTAIHPGRFGGFPGIPRRRL